MTNFKLMAGTNIGLRQNNEDNFTVCSDLAKNDWGIPVNYQEEIELGELGCLLVVADGMGGQNAGEVASAIAIETVHDMFAPDVLPKNVTGSGDSVDNYLKKVICEADVRIKKRTREDVSTSGMGSTIVIVWVVGKYAHVAWLGDSRAYCVVKDKGIARLTKDHSYVQGLVDAGKITDEQAMNHPDSNIINRSLGDSSQRAKPDVVSIELAEGEVILLCSDGLCGVCQDAIIGGIVEDNIDDLKECRELLTSAALASGGSDNITIAMIQICNCDDSKSDTVSAKTSGQKTGRNAIVYSILSVVIVALLCVLFFTRNSEKITYRLDVKPSSLTLDKGLTSQLKVEYITLKDGIVDESQTIDVTDRCVWTSSDLSDISVSQKGIVTAKTAASSATITITYENCFVQCVVTVNPEHRSVSDANKEVSPQQDLVDKSIPVDTVSVRNMDKNNESAVVLTPSRTKVVTKSVEDTNRIVDGNENRAPVDTIQNSI